MKLLSIIIYSLLTINNALAASFNIEANGIEPLYQSTLTKEAYQASHRDNLEDLTILNAAGEPIPYAVVPNEVLYPSTVEESTPLKIFSMQNVVKKSHNNINIDLEQGGKAAININHNPATDQAKTTFLFDLGKKHPLLKKLKVDWQGAEGKPISVQAFTSDNLKDWTNIGQSVIFKNTSDGQTILQNTIELYAFTEERYLQLRPELDDTDFKLIAVSAEYQKERKIVQPKLWQILKLLSREQAQNGVINIDYESAARFPASDLRVDLPQINTMTHVRIFTRNQADVPWDEVISMPIYRLNKQGRDTVNPDIKINSRVARYWRLQFNQSNGGIGTENPTVGIGWLANTIVWNARGDAPYTLHLGENAKTTNAMHLSNLMPNYTQEKIKAIPVANLSPVNNTPEANPNPWHVATDYKRWLLWLGLTVGVILLALMAYSLLKNKQ